MHLEWYLYLLEAVEVGAKLTSHPAIAKVVFTGSTATGQRIMQSAAATFKHLTLELGGNDAGIVLLDTDIQAMAARIFMEPLSTWARLVQH